MVVKYLGRAGVQSHQLPMLIFVPHVRGLEAALEVLKEENVLVVSIQCPFSTGKEAVLGCVLIICWQFEASLNLYSGQI